MTERRPRAPSARTPDEQRSAASRDARDDLPIEAVVVAAGVSRRMGGIDKLAANLGGRSVLRRSVEALAAAGIERIAIVTAASRVAEITAAAWLPDAVVAVVAGGERRHESVAAGVTALAATSDAADAVVLVHDAARPLVTPGLVRDVAAAVLAHGAAIPVLPVAETLKRVRDGEIVGTIERADVATAQTPQGALRSLLLRAYAAYPPSGPEIWTDEASLLEACRIAVHAIDGEASNIKVTVPADLVRAEALIRSGTPPVPAIRVGLGMDEHPFGPAGSLALGGLRIAGAPRLVGHSDGDVVLHAVADALLGAAGLGDLGRIFPADGRTPLGADSRELLAEVVARVAASGWRPANVDVTMVAARPRLAELLPAMGEGIGAILGLGPGTVNVKASTGNLEGPDGGGRSISATAVVTIVASPGGAEREE